MCGGKEMVEVEILKDKTNDRWAPHPPHVTSMGVTGPQNGGSSWLHGRVNSMLCAGLAEKTVFPSKQIIDYKLL